MTTPILKALAELEDASSRAEKYEAAVFKESPGGFTCAPYCNGDFLSSAYEAGAASMLPAVQAVKVLVEAMEKIGYTQDVSPADSETGGPCRIAVANSRNRRILEAQEALRVAARIISEGR